MRLRKTKAEKAKALVVLAACGLVISLALTMGQDEALANAGRLLFFPFCALLVFSVLRHRKIKNTSERPGLLTSDKRPPLSAATRAHYTYTLGLAIQHVSAVEQTPQHVKDKLTLLANQEIARLALLWTDGNEKALSDDELRSVQILYLSSLVVDGKVRPLDPELDAMIGDRATVDALRTRIQTVVDTQRENSEKRAAWRARVGDPDASHMLEEGWIAFLQGLKDPDVLLWHSIVCDFHEIWGDRLDAAYWICAQPECDRATVWTFIAGLATGEILHTELSYAARRGEDLSRIASAYSDIVRKWNTGFYPYHSIANDDDLPDTPEKDAAERLNTELEAIEAEFDVSLERVTYLDFDTDAASDDLSRSTTSGFAFWDDEGLHLTYPHDWPEKKPAA